MGLKERCQFSLEFGRANQGPATRPGSYGFFGPDFSFLPVFLLDLTLAESWSALVFFRASHSESKAGPFFLYLSLLGK